MISYLKFFRARRQRQAFAESGYTMQTLIIIAILVLAATITFTVVYAILRDSTDNIVGGAETFDGLPSGPQNLEISVSRASSTAIDITASWDAPSYLGENTLIGYSPEVQPVGGDGTEPKSCNNYLDINDRRAGTEPDNPDGFSTSNTCQWEQYTVAADMEYELVFGIELSDIGGVSFTERIELGSPPQDVQVSSVGNAALGGAIVVSWEKTSENVSYRLRIKDVDGTVSETPDNDYIICITPEDDQASRYMQEIPNTLGRPSEWESDASTFPKVEMRYSIELAASIVGRGITDEESCIDEENENFGPSIIFEGGGIPPIPFFSINPEPADSGSNFFLPMVTITSTSACNSEDVLFTFYWAEVGKPQTVQEISFSTCEVTLPIPFIAESQITYSIWGIATNKYGVSQRTPTRNWATISDPNIPASPKSLKTIWIEDSQITISWAPPEIDSNRIPDGYSLKTFMVDNTGECVDNNRPVELLSGQTYTVTIPAIERLCIEVFSIANGQQSSPAEIKTSEPPLGFTTTGTKDISVSWQAGNPSEVSHYVVVLSTADECPEDQIILTRTIFNRFGTSILTSTIPLIHVNSWICVSAIYEDGSVEGIFNSTMLEASQERQPPEIRIVELEDSVDVDGNRIDNLTLTGTISAPSNDPRYSLRLLSYYICLDVLVPDLTPPDNWNEAGTGEAEIAVLVSYANPMSADDTIIDVDIIDHGDDSALIVDINEFTNMASFTYNPLQNYISVSMTLDPITTMSSRTYEARVWTSYDESCEYPGPDEPAYIPVSHTTSP